MIFVDYIEYVQQCCYFCFKLEKKIQIEIFHEFLKIKIDKQRKSYIILPPLILTPPYTSYMRKCIAENQKKVNKRSTK